VRHAHKIRKTEHESRHRREKEAMGGGDTEGQGNEKTRGTTTETDRSFTEEDGRRHAADKQEQTVRKTMQIRSRRGRARLRYNENSLGKTSRTPGERKQSMEAGEKRRRNQRKNKAARGRKDKRKQACTDVVPTVLHDCARKIEK